MKPSTLSWIALVVSIIALIFAVFFPGTAQAAAVWDVNLVNQYGSDAPFTLVGTFTTADDQINRGQGEAILSFNAMLNGVQTSLVPLGTDPAFDYDNLFFGPTDIAAGWSTLDAFDYRGVVLTVPGDSFNVYSGAVLVGLYASGASLALDGTITFAGFTSSVDEPMQATLWMLALAAAIITMRGRRAILHRV